MRETVPTFCDFPQPRLAIVMVSEPQQENAEISYEMNEINYQHGKGSF
jgi:hypothetical protein